MQPTMKKIFLITAFYVCTVGALYAQSNTSLTYSIGFTTGDLNEFIGNTSFRGIGLDYRKMVQPNIGVGLSFGWNVFYEELNRATYTIDNVSLTGKQYRYSNHFPMLVTGSYFLKPGEEMNPFVGLGIGTIYTKRNTDMNLYTLEQEAWNFALQPEIGIQRTFDGGAGFTISGKYFYGFKSGNELDEPQSYFAIN
jgi:outer membrane protein W